MKYRKPKVVELGTRLKRANGQVSPEACISGATAGTFETCGTGTTAQWDCVSGGTPGSSHGGCASGSTADAGGDCFTGSVVQYYCGVGTAGTSDPAGCVAGPSFA